MPGAAPAAGVAASFGSATQDSPESARELDLGDGEMRLPWLEGDDEDYEDERGGVGQTTILLLAALVAIALLGGGILWALAGRSDEELVADGGVIEAPEEPYKTRPENPGGEVVSGTGDTSFAVAEGQSRTPQIAEEELPGPGFDGLDEAESSAAAPQSKPVPAAKAEEPAAPSGVGVQVGAYTSREGAEKGWQTLKGQYAPFGDMSHRVVQGQADIGTVYRLQALPGDLKAAKALCADMRGAGLACQVKN
ncbi:SPOR domain-containing protein [Novosphingobium sp. BW1]|nr:SPOR domain-containing protein [Novosphingobium sp. BW1]